MKRLTRAEKGEVVAIAGQMQGARPRYSLEYIAALYGVSRWTISKFSSWRDRRGRRRPKAWRR